MPKAATQGSKIYKPLDYSEWINDQLKQRYDKKHDKPFVLGICDLKRVSPRECEISSKNIFELVQMAKEFCGENMPFELTKPGHDQEIREFIHDNFFATECKCRFCNKLRRKASNEEEIEEQKRKDEEERKKQLVEQVTILIDLLASPPKAKEEQRNSKYTEEETEDEMRENWFNF